MEAACVPQEFSKKPRPSPGSLFLLQLARIGICGGSLITCQKPSQQSTCLAVRHGKQSLEISAETISSEASNSKLLKAGTLSDGTFGKGESPQESKWSKYVLWVSLSIFTMATVGTYQALTIEIWPHQVEMILGSESTRKSFVTGCMTGVNGLAGFIVSPVAGKLADRFGRRRMFTFLGVLMAVLGLMTCSLWTSTAGISIWALIPVIIFFNLGLGTAAVCSDTLIPEVLPTDQLTGCSMFKGFFQVLGECVGQIGVSYLITANPDGFLGFYGLVSVIILVCALPPVFGTLGHRSAVTSSSQIIVQTEAPTSAASDTNSTGDTQYRRNRWLIVVARFFLMASIFLYTSFLQYLFEDAFVVSNPTLYTAYVTVTISCAGLIGVFAGGFMASRLSTKWPVQIASVIVMIGHVVLSWATWVLNVPVFFVGAGIAGVGWGCNMSSEQVLMVDCAPSKFQMGVDFGLLTAATNLGLLLCPSIGGFVISALLEFGTSYKMAMVAVFSSCLASAVLSFMLIYFVRIPSKNKTQPESAPNIAV